MGAFELSFIERSIVSTRMAKDKPPSLQHIARLAGKAKSTVSLALRNDPRLPASTCRRIQNIAARLGYRPNATLARLMAQLHAGEKTRIKAALALVDVWPEPGVDKRLETFRLWHEGIASRAGQMGYALDCFDIHEPGQRPERLLRILKSRGIQGLVLRGLKTRSEIDAAWLPMLESFPSVVVGVEQVAPAMYAATNDQFDTALIHVRRLHGRGYRRLGIVVDEETERLLHYRFTCGYWAGMYETRCRRPLPPLHISWSGRAAFLAWFRRHRPDAIICNILHIWSWLEEEGVEVPAEMGISNLDLGADEQNWAGTHQNSALVGSAAVDLVIGQIHRNERGLNPHPKCVLIRSTWQEGPSVTGFTRAAASLRQPARREAHK